MAKRDYRGDNGRKAKTKSTLIQEYQEEKLIKHAFEVSATDLGYQTRTERSLDISFVFAEEALVEQIIKQSGRIRTIKI